MMAFSGIDIVLRDRISKSKISEVIAELLDVDNTKISIIENIESYPEKDKSEIVCIMTKCDGPFALILSIQCPKREIGVDSKNTLIKSLAEKWGTDILFTDEGEDPYYMWLANRNGQLKMVELDVVEYDKGVYSVKQE